MWKFAIALIFLCASANGAQYSNRGGSRNAPFEDLRHEVDNHEVEIRMFEERLNTQEVIVDSLRQQVLDANHENRELVKACTIQLESQAAKAGGSSKDVIDDLRRLQSHGNNTASVLNQHKQKIEEIEKKLDQLQDTLQLVLDALQVPSKLQVYEVVSGDTLEKIARKNKTTIQKIKECNQLSSDRIYSGQKLKMP